MEAWRAKQRAIKTLEEKLGEGERREAEQDHHAKRLPRPCGITVHTGVGCSLACAYCYIYDNLWSFARRTCTRERPKCDVCPFREVCKAYSLRRYPPEHLHLITWYY